MFQTSDIQRIHRGGMLPGCAARPVVTRMLLDAALQTGPG